MGLFKKVVNFASSAGGGNVIGSALGAVGSLIGGRNAAAQAQSQMDMQREFAQNGIRWKVADAKAAGIHPLAALGAQTFSYNPVITGDTGVGEALAKMGQGVSRAAEAKQLAAERAANDAIRNLQIRGLELDNKMKEQQIQADYTRQAFELADRVVATQGQVPSMPVVNDNGKGGPSSVTPGVSPFWDHFRNFDWIMPVPSGDLKDYVGENIFLNLASQLGYGTAAWSGQVRPSDSSLTSEERAKLQSGLYTSNFYPLMGWRVEPNLRHYLLKLVSLFSPAMRSQILRKMRK